MPKLTTDLPRAMRIRLSDEDVEQLRSIAQVCGITVSEFVRRSFRETIAAVSVPDPPAEVPPLPADSDWIPDEIERLVASGGTSREELEAIAAREWENLREEARVFDDFDGLPSAAQAAYREHDALRAWVRALGSVESVPDARERQERLDERWKHWRRAMNERKAEYAHRDPKARRIALATPIVTPRQRPRARRPSSRRRAARAPTSDDSSEPPLDEPRVRVLRRAQAEREQRERGVEP
jgi:hypothetical protein